MRRLKIERVAEYIYSVGDKHAEEETIGDIILKKGYKK